MSKSSSANSAKPSETNNPYASLLTAREARAVYRALELVQKTLVEKPIVLTDARTVRDYLQLELALEEREVFVCLFLDAKHRLIKAERMFYGTLTETSVYPREVVKTALRHNASAVIFAHNHPSGNCRPSEADKDLTVCLESAMALVGVRVLDHFIVANGSRPLSFAECDLLSKYQPSPSPDRPTKKRRAKRTTAGAA